MNLYSKLEKESEMKEWILFNGMGLLVGNFLWLFCVIMNNIADCVK